MFSVDSGVDLARSLPTTVPESPSTSQPRTPRTPRTPGRQDPNKTPRFYPVMKESASIDGQVSSPLRVLLPVRLFVVFLQRDEFKFLLPDAEEEEDPPQLQPPPGSSHRLGDGLPGTSLTFCIHQVTTLKEAKTLYL